MRPDQLNKFKQAARELEANDDPAEFDRKMRSAKLRTPPKADQPIHEAPSQPPAKSPKGRRQS